MDKKEIKEKKKIIEERLELLEGFAGTIEAGGGIPLFKLGGLLDDLYILNPATHEQTVIYLRDRYREEMDRIKVLSKRSK